MHIHWHLSQQQADQILSTLAQRPFAEVNTLIQELLRQANDKVPSPTQLVPVSRTETIGGDRDS